MNDLNSRSAKMIYLLRKNGKMKLRELAEVLGVKERQVRSYKIILENIGYRFITHAGKSGGYELIEEKLTPEEMEVIQTLIPESLFEKLERIIERI